MKKILLSLITIFIFNISYAQKGSVKDVDQTCYQKYAKVFEKRGAYDIEDGTYDDVIITIRKGSMAECYYGKVVVKDTKIDPNEIYLKFEDGTFEKVDKKYRYPEQDITIVNGMSKTMITVDDELITILFVKKIKPKKKAYVKAVDPDFDF